MFRASYQVAGKQLRRFFETEPEARKFATAKKRELDSTGSYWLELPTVDRIELMAAAQRARERGVRLTDAVSAYVRTVEQCRVTVADAVREALAEKRGQRLREETLYKMERYYSRFAAIHGHRLLSEMTPANIADYLKGFDWEAVTVKGVRADLQTLFGWGVRHGHIKDNPVAATVAPKVDPKRPGILTPAQCRALLESAAANDPGLCGYFAICLFAGIRPKEAARLDASAVNLERGFVEIDGARAKTRERRIVTLEAPGIAWARLGVSLPPVNLKPRSERLRRAAGVLSAWSHDCMRHSYASYHLAMHKNPALTAYEMGNSPEILYRHYRELVSEEDAKAFWSIFPSNGAECKPEPTSVSAAL